jgi:hypothetical protein
MGKRSVSEANQRIAASRVLEVSCDPTRLTSAIQGLIDRWNSAADAAFESSLASKSRFQRWVSSGDVPSGRHYFLLERPEHLWVTFGVRAARVAERGFNPNDRGWLSAIAPGPHEASGTMQITVTLAKWSVNDARLIWNGERYVQLLDGLVAGLDGRYISAPVDEEDLHFIRYA